MHTDRLLGLRKYCCCWTCRTSKVKFHGNAPWNQCHKLAYHACSFPFPPTDHWSGGPVHEDDGYCTILWLLVDRFTGRQTCMSDHEWHGECASPWHFLTMLLVPDSVQDISRDLWPHDLFGIHNTFQATRERSTCAWPPSCDTNGLRIGHNIGTRFTNLNAPTSFVSLTAGSIIMTRKPSETQCESMDQPVSQVSD